MFFTSGRSILMGLIAVTAPLLAASTAHAQNRGCQGQTGSRQLNPLSPQNRALYALPPAQLNALRQQAQLNALQQQAQLNAVQQQQPQLQPLAQLKVLAQQVQWLAAQQPENAAQQNAQFAALQQLNALIRQAQADALQQAQLKAFQP